MRVVTVHPGPDWSVADCHRGWTRAFRQLGCQVVEFDTGNRLDFYDRVRLDRSGEMVPAIPDDADRAKLVSKHLESVLYETWPDVVFVTYGAAIDPSTLQLARERGHVVVLYHTEAPYEDSSRLTWAEHGVADIWLINDPTNLERWRQHCSTTWYLPHSYDPDIHRPSNIPVPQPHDVTFVGSSFPSRIDWFTRFVAAAPDLAVTLAGNWMTITPDHPLAGACRHRFAECVDNVDVPPLYWASKVGLNVYRTEAERPELAEGWAMGPREVEMAACGLFHMTEPRGENRDVLAMLPTFESPGEAAEQARWWTQHPDQRDRVAAQARQAVGTWTFRNRAAQVLGFIDRLSRAA